MEIQSPISQFNSILYGDCIDVMRSISDLSIDLVVTDPPYLTNYTPRDGRKVANDVQGDWLYPSFSEIYRLLKPNAFCVSFYGWPHADFFLGAWKRIGFRPVGHLICLKKYSSRRGYTLGHHETLYLLAKGHPHLPARPSKDVLDWRYTGNLHHPTQKPVEIMRKLIEMFSRPQDVILDPFAGSGTTGIAALDCGRRFILIEKELECFQHAQERLNKKQGAGQSSVPAATMRCSVPE